MARMTVELASTGLFCGCFLLIPLGAFTMALSPTGALVAPLQTTFNHNAIPKALCVNKYFYGLGVEMWRSFLNGKAGV